MPERKKKLPLLGREVDVTDVPIKRSSEPFSEYELEDGTILRVKSVATSIMRVDGEFAPDGKPVYLVSTSPMLVVDSATLTRKQ